MPNPAKIQTDDHPYEVALWERVTWSVGIEGANAITVTATLVNANNNAIGERAVINAWLSTDNTGATPITTAPTGNVTIGASGSIRHLVTDKEFRLVTTTGGVVSLVITDSGAYSVYLNFMNPLGKIVTSPVIALV